MEQMFIVLDCVSSYHMISEYPLTCDLQEETYWHMDVLYHWITMIAVAEFEPPLLCWVLEFPRDDTDEVTEILTELSNHNER